METVFSESNCSRIIYTKQGHEILVSEKDYHWLSQWNWFVKDTGYAVRGARKEENQTGRYFIIRMHREIANLPRRGASHLQIDHINRNRLDNRRENLRIVTNTENTFNRTKKNGATSKYAGVSWDKNRRSWVAFIQVDRKSINLGGFKSEEEAHFAYLVAKNKFHKIKNGSLV